MSGPTSDPPGGDNGVRRVSELSDSGLLWLINATTFHPRGFALALIQQADGGIVGWELLGDGSEPWRFADDMDERFRAAEATLSAARKAAGT